MPTKKTQIKLAVVDDHRLFRKGLISLINLVDEENYLVLYEAEHGKDLINKIDKKALPDIVIMDIDMREMDGFETVAWLQEHYPEIRILVVSMIEKEEAIVRMLRLGVKGYLSKDIEPEDIHAALKAIVNKGYYYTDFITGKLIHSIQNEHKRDIEGTNSSASDDIWHKLTQREREFIKLACSELTYQEIAAKMFLSPKTVDNYRESLFEKFKVKNRVGLVLYALRNDLVKL
jgi:two-component system invasion response regulator UvrY